MATHDYVIANASGAAVRDDLNKALAAIVSNNSNATEPATTYAYMLWYDTTAGQLKMRNAANDGWVVVPVLDSSDRLLIGTSTSTGVLAGVTPQVQLEGTSIHTSSASLFANENDAGTAPILFFGRSRGADTGSSTVVQSEDRLGGIYFQGADGTDRNTAAAYISAYVDGTPGANDMPGRLMFATTADGASSPTERMRITNAGNVGIGATSPYYALDVVNGIGITEGSALNWHNGSGSNSAQIFGDASDNLIFRNTSSDTERMRIDSNGQVGIGTTPQSGRIFSVKGSTSDSSASVNIFFNSTGTELFRIRNDGAFYSGVGTLSPYNLTTASAANVFVDSGGVVRRSTSSIRFKTDIETLQDSYADAILQCRPVWYRSTAGDDNPSWGWWGFIAEEVAEIDPRLVFWKTHETTTDQEGNTTSTELETPIAEGVQYDRFVPHLLNLVKRQKEQIETLEAKVAALEAA